MGSMKKKRQKKANKDWAEFQAQHELSDDDIRKAKEMGLSLQALIRNVQSLSQHGNAAAKVWIQELYEKHILSSSKPVINHDSIVRDWEENAERNDDANYNFLRRLKHQEHGFDADEVAGELHRKAFQIVDCTQCANCCKTKRPTFDESDVERIAGHLNMDQAEFIDTYLEANADDPPYSTSQAPCPFLGEDNRCTVYEIRPATCREYPYTDKEGLVFRTMGVANNALVCPAVFWIVEQMKQRAGQHDENDY